MNKNIKPKDWNNISSEDMDKYLQDSWEWSLDFIGNNSIDVVEITTAEYYLQDDGVDYGVNYDIKKSIKSIEGQQHIYDFYFNIKAKLKSETRVSKYHGLEHIFDMLHQIDLCSEHIVRRDAVECAAFLHEYTFNPLRYDNVLRNAANAIQILTAYGDSYDGIYYNDIIPYYYSNWVYGLIKAMESTIFYEEDEKYFRDAHLAIYGSEWNTFERYLNGIKDEYDRAVSKIGPHLDLENKIYGSFFGRVPHCFCTPEKIDGHIFVTDFFKDLYEENAQKNYAKQIVWVKERVKDMPVI
ncbi:hypothetical protein ACFL1H_04445 [Nanoarchaeota archaeon]